TYGWNSLNSNARDRNKNSDQRYDTLAQMQYGGKSYQWEIAVPNGTYKVHVVAGDASYLNSLYGITAESHTIVSGIPTSTKHWFEGTANITVSDGRLTIRNASAAIHNKTDFHDITPPTNSAHHIF